MGTTYTSINTNGYSFGTGASGVIVLGGSGGFYGTTIQNYANNTYIDNSTSSTGTIAFTPILNIGTITNQSIVMGSATNASRIDIQSYGGTIALASTNGMVIIDAGSGTTGIGSGGGTLN